MKAVMISIQPYWVFLIIAKSMVWEIDQHKEIEVRKNYPKAFDWNKVAKIYCSKDKKSFNKIPEKYRPAMKKFLGKVIGHFVCDGVDKFSVFENNTVQYWNYHNLEKSCLTYDEISNYIDKNKNGYAWHISDLVIYDGPKELSKFYHACKLPNGTDCSMCFDGGKTTCWSFIRPPQSWCYVEDKEN